MRNGDDTNPVSHSNLHSENTAAHVAAQAAADTAAAGTLEADGIRLSYGEKTVLRSVYVKVAAGRVTALLGRNGCGKSTLMGIIHGSLDTPDKSVRVDGKVVSHGYLHGVMLAPQRGFIPASRTIRGVVRDYRLDFDRLTDLFPLFAERRTARVGSLSGGERRLLETFAVLTSPAARFCLLDEPFAQVSPLHVEALQRLIREERRTKGILLTDHTYRPILDTADDIYLIVGGATRHIRSHEELRQYGYLL